MFWSKITQISGWFRRVGFHVPQKYSGIFYVGVHGQSRWIQSYQGWVSICLTASNSKQSPNMTWGYLTGSVNRGTKKICKHGKAGCRRHTDDVIWTTYGWCDMEWLFMTVLRGMVYIESIKLDPTQTLGKAKGKTGFGGKDTKQFDLLASIS